MTIEAWLLFCVTEAVLSCTPGPAVLFVVSTALGDFARQSNNSLDTAREKTAPTRDERRIAFNPEQHPLTPSSRLLLAAYRGAGFELPGKAALGRGAAAGISASLGILGANAAYFILSATGIGAVLLASGELFFLIKWVGAAYLVWLGLGMLLSRTTPLAPTPAPPRRSLLPFVNGLITQGANPKALVFFTAILPQFIDPTHAVPTQIAILGISSILIEFAILSIYVAICHRARPMIDTSGFAMHLNRAGGVLLIGAGVGLASLRRS